MVTDLFLRAQESLAIVQQVNDTGIVADPTLDLKAAVGEAIARNGFFALPSAISIVLPKLLSESIHTLQHGSYSSTGLGTVLRAYAGIVAGVGTEAIFPLIKQKLEHDRLEMQRKKLEQIRGFALEGETPLGAMKRHSETLYESIRAGVFADSDRFAQAILELSTAGLAGYWNMYPNLVPSQQSAYVAALGSGKYATDAPKLFDQDQLGRAEILLDECRKQFGVEQRGSGPLTTEQDRAISFLKSAIEVPLIAKRHRPEVQQFLENVYGPEIDAIQPGSFDDLRTRIEMLDQCDKVFSSNIPRTRLERAIDKIIDTINYPYGRADVDQPMTQTPLQAPTNDGLSRGFGR